MHDRAVPVPEHLVVRPGFCVVIHGHAAPRTAGRAAQPVRVAVVGEVGGREDNQPTVCSERDALLAPGHLFVPELEVAQPAGLPAPVQIHKGVDAPVHAVLVVAVAVRENVEVGVDLQVSTAHHLRGIGRRPRGSGAGAECLGWADAVTKRYIDVDAYAWLRGAATLPPLLPPRLATYKKSTWHRPACKASLRLRENRNKNNIPRRRLACDMPFPSLVQSAKRDWMPLTISRKRMKKGSCNSSRQSTIGKGIARRVSISIAPPCPRKSRADSSTLRQQGGRGSTVGTVKTEPGAGVLLGLLSAECEAEVWKCAALDEALGGRVPCAPRRHWSS
eukprot:scaffold519_cov102-Isochrysis_galbana.AAC.6